MKVFHVAFLFTLVPFLSKPSSGIKERYLQQKQANFVEPSGNSRIVLSDCVCDYLPNVRLEQGCHTVPKEANMTDK